MAQLSAAQQRIAELEAQVARTDSRDPLARTLLTLRAFRTQLDLDVARAQRYQRPLSVALIDIDGFRRINLRHGYAMGDEVLATIGNVISDETRVHDLACRMAGDEFALLLPESRAPAAHQAIERLLIRLEHVVVGPVSSLSVSVGIAEMAPKQSSEQLLATAAEALNQARAAGGHQAVVYEGPVADEPDGGTHTDVVVALASALEARDQYTGDHSESVVEMAARVAEAMGLAPDEVARVRMGALLHDIGKVGIPDHVLHKAGPLNDDEWVLMREHPVIGERILRMIPGLGPIARIVRHEHERWDGGGYPDGISGTDIPIGSRIILACDAYHAMTSDRPYRQAMPHADAMAELGKHAGSQFDPEVVEALIGYLYGRRQAGAAA
jgi:diguanylate cyclase (GGDEF)-like protein/putative nucleotidyltransferase with HDIG domain